MSDALDRGLNVIYDAPNIGQNTRLQFLELAKKKGVYTTLHVMNGNEKGLTPSVEISNDEMRKMKEKFLSQYPSAMEGWDHIEYNGKEISERKTGADSLKDERKHSFDEDWDVTDV